MRKIRTCKICKKKFYSEKYHPYQKICNNKVCKRTSKINYLKSWRRKYPNYFEGRRDNVENIKKWKVINKEYLNKYHKAYRINNLNTIRKKTKEYVRTYRAKRVSKKQTIDI